MTKNSNQQTVILKPGKEKALLNRHHWIFSGAVQSLPTFKNGDFLKVYSSNNHFLGYGYFNRKSNIIGRMVSFTDQEPLEAIRERMDQALIFRKQIFKSGFNKELTNAYRLINGEGDGLPGLIVDVYDKVIVIQISTQGIDRIRSFIVDYLVQNLQPQAIYEKSLLPARKEEGLEPYEGLLFGQIPEKLIVKENGLLFQVQIEKSQKTGFFLDHREMRKWMGTLSEGRKVLNAFSYSGGFSVYALSGGAARVDSVDISQEAMSLAKENVKINGFSEEVNGFYVADVFQFLREKELNYELVILDPPAFAKRQKDVVQACRGYKDINRLAMKKMPSQSYLLTCSCSHHVDEELFQKVVFQAAVEADRTVRIIGKHRLAMDHPVNLFHPESDYLKSLLLYIE